MFFCSSNLNVLNTKEKLRPHYNKNLEHFRLNQHRFKRFQKFTSKNWIKINKLPKKL